MWERTNPGIPDQINTTTSFSNLGFCYKQEKVPSIEKIIFNDPVTIVMWNDGTKTIVKTSVGESFNQELDVAAAICKKMYGSRSAFLKVIEKKSATVEKPTKEKKDNSAMSQTFESLIKAMSGYRYGGTD